MKLNKLKYLGLLLLPALGACSDNDDPRYDIPTPEDQMHLTPSVEEIVLDPEQADAVALTLTWGEAADRGPTATIKYLFRMDVADNQFLTGTDFEEMTENKVEFTTKELNQFLLARGIRGGASAAIEAEVVASVEDSTLYKKPEVSKVRVSVVTYDPSRPLYLIDSETGLEGATLMKAVVEGEQYEYTGILEEGKGYKFVYNTETGTPSLNKGAGATELVYSTSADDASSYFEVSKTGRYTISVNAPERKCTITYYLPTSMVLMCGGAAPCGWGCDNQGSDWEKFTRDASNPAIFTWTGNLGEGDVQFPCDYADAATGSWGNLPIINPESDNMPAIGGSENISYCLNDDPDWRWKVEEAGNYTITINVNLLTIQFVKND